MDIDPRLAAAIQEHGHKGYTRDDGEYVDAIEVQKAAISVGFEKASEETGFDVWTVVNPNVALREGEPLASNFERVINQWGSVVSRPEMEERIREMYDLDENEEP